MGEDCFGLYSRFRTFREWPEKVEKEKERTRDNDAVLLALVISYRTEIPVSVRGNCASSTYWIQSRVQTMILILR